MSDIKRTEGQGLWSWIDPIVKKVSSFCTIISNVAENILSYLGSFFFDIPNKSSGSSLIGRVTVIPEEEGLEEGGVEVLPKSLFDEDKIKMQVTQELDNWVENAPLQEKVDREIARKKMETFLENPEKGLDLGGLSLSSLPDIEEWVVCKKRVIGEVEAWVDCSTPEEKTDRKEAQKRILFFLDHPETSLDLNGLSLTKTPYIPQQLSVRERLEIELKKVIFQSENQPVKESSNTFHMYKTIKKCWASYFNVLERFLHNDFEEEKGIDSSEGRAIASIERWSAGVEHGEEAKKRLIDFLEDKSPTMDLRDLHLRSLPDVSDSKLFAEKLAGYQGSRGCGINNYGNTCYMNAPLQLFARSYSFLHKALEGLKQQQQEREEFLERIVSLEKGLKTAISEDSELGYQLKKKCVLLDLTLAPKQQQEKLLAFYSHELDRMKELSIGIQDANLYNDLVEAKKKLETKPKTTLSSQEWKSLCDRWNEQRKFAYTKDDSFHVMVLKQEELYPYEYDRNSLKIIKEQLVRQINFISCFGKIIEKLRRNETLDRKDVLDLAHYYVVYCDSPQLQEGDQLDSIEFCDKIFKLLIESLPSVNTTFITQTPEGKKVMRGMNALPILEEKANDKTVSVRELIAKSIAIFNQKGEIINAPTYVSSESKNLFFQFPRTKGDGQKNFQVLSDIKEDGTLTLPSYDETLPKPHIREKSYNLVSVIIHVGATAASGHYVFINKTLEGKYFLYNDDQVSEVQESAAIDFIRKNGCVYLFSAIENEKCKKIISHNLQ